MPGHNIVARTWQNNYNIMQHPQMLHENFDHCQAPANTTYRNNVGRSVLRAFSHHVEACCSVLQHVGCCWPKFENGQIFDATFVHAH